MLALVARVVRFVFDAWESRRIRRIEIGMPASSAGADETISIRGTWVCPSCGHRCLYCKRRLVEPSDPPVK